MQRRKDAKVTAHSSTGIADFSIQILSAITFLLRRKINIVVENILEDTHIFICNNRFGFTATIQGILFKSILRQKCNYMFHNIILPN